MGPSPHAESLVGRAPVIELNEATSATLDRLAEAEARACPALRSSNEVDLRLELLPAQQMLLQRALVLREPISIPADATR